MDCTQPVFIEHNEEVLPVPCNKCLPCLSNKRVEWSIRLLQEHKHSNQSCFITLTYHPRFLPKDNKLHKRHVQLFMKRLRKKTKNKLRYYCVGEYGTHGGRPHYHLLLFNCLGVSRRDIDSAWSYQGKSIGLTHLGQVTAASVAYCTKYMVQPKKEGQFTIMSRAYGLGGKYLNDLTVSWHREDDRTYMVIDGHKTRLPKFYRDKIFPTVKSNGTRYDYSYNKTQMRKRSKKQRKEKYDNETKALIERGLNPEKYRAVAILKQVQRINKTVKYSQTL